MIQSSTYTEGPPQVDGRRYVKETHTDDTGKTYAFEWLGSQDAGAVMTARADSLNAQLAAQAEALALVSGTQLPLTKLQFRKLFTQSERESIDALHAGFESLAYLTAEQKATLRTGLEDYRTAENIAKPFELGVYQMVGMYQALGILTDERAAEVLA